jgi:hypothetical protein
LLTERKVALPLSTAPSRKLAIGLPLFVPRMPVAPRPKLKEPASLPLAWMLPPMLRYSKPALTVWFPLIQVSRSFAT